MEFEKSETKLNVLVACEYSGAVRDAFLKLGHNAISCDLLPTDAPGPHYQGDVLDLITGENAKKFDLLIAHPPCTRLANSGVRWLKERNLWQEMREAALFFKKFLDCEIPLKAVENPIPHKYALEIIGRKYDQIIQPWQFGHGETKATCLWIDGLPNLKPTNVVEGREQRIWLLPPGPDRWKERSRTFQGIADAIAEQWGNIHNRADNKQLNIFTNDSCKI